MSKQGGIATAKKDQGLSRATRKGCVGEPDVVVVVGNQEFNEYSKQLCCWSEYFDAALCRCGMKESTSKRVEFPDEDPKEWTLITDMLSPGREKKITEENLKTILHWSNKLLIPTLLEMCENYLMKDVLNVDAEWIVRKAGGCTKDLDMVLEYLPWIVEANLTVSKAKALEIVILALERSPSSFTPDHLTTIVHSLKDDEISWSRLSGHLKEGFPKLFPTEDSSTKKKEGGDLFALLLLAVCGLKMAQEEEKLSDKKRQMMEKEADFVRREKHLNQFNREKNDAFVSGILIGCFGFFFKCFLALLGELARNREE